MKLTKYDEICGALENRNRRNLNKFRKLAKQISELPERRDTECQ